MDGDQRPATARCQASDRSNVVPSQRWGARSTSQKTLNKIEDVFDDHIKHEQR